ncbi:MAG: hypothetical protein ACR2P0_18260 [Acidimicrobiales bacterium]
MSDATTPSAPAPVEWVSFLDEKGETWLFDLSFFRSNWKCIYGAGCAGIEETPDVEGQRGCCSYGAHFADDADLGRVMDIARALPADLWQHHVHRPDPKSNMSALVDALTEVDDDGDRKTITVDGGCVFLNRPGFGAGAGCALHIAAARTGVEPLAWKPEVCWQLPIRVEHHLDDHDQQTHLVRQWTRADWGEAGADLAWWCSEAAESYVGTDSVASYLRAEVAAFAGERVADALIAHAGERATVVGLPDPVRR